MATFVRFGKREGFWYIYGDINDNSNVKRLYLSYLDLVYKGYTPNDTSLRSAETAFRDAALAAGISDSTIADATIAFRLADVFPGYWHDTEGVMFRGDRRLAIDWAEGQWDTDCGMPFCSPSSDRVVRLLGGGDSDKESLFVDNGFRVTGAVDTDYTAFGVWAQDSYWGFWQSEIRTKRKATGSTGSDFGDSTLYSFVDGTDTVFIAGGRDPQYPRIGTGTWQGLAVGKHKLLPDVRVGRSEIVVNFEASEVDVIISGLVFGGAVTASFDGQQQDVEAGNTLS